jgi:voltage-gated potassium channel
MGTSRTRPARAAHTTKPGRRMTTPNPATGPAAAPPDRATLDAERERLLRQVEAIGDPIMIGLGLVFLVLLLLQVSSVPLTDGEQAFVNRADDVIYGVFVADFLLRLLIVPNKAAYLKANWLLAASLAVPALRPLKLVRVAPMLGSLHAAQVVGGANRGLTALRLMLRGRVFLYLSMVTVVVVLIGAGGVLRLDAGHPGTPFTSFGEALWWAATLITTVNSSDDPVSGWGRVVAFLMRIYAVAIFGYLTGSIASYFVAEVRQGASAGPHARSADDASPPKPVEGPQ